MSEIGAHYKFEYRGIKLDPYRIFEIYRITHSCQQHAIKKLLRAGKAHKTLRKDIEEVISTCNRWLEMMDEDAKEKS